MINDLILDEKNKIVKVDKIEVDYFDNSDNKNKFVLKLNKKMPKFVRVCWICKICLEITG